MLRQLKRSFGISASRMAVRPDVPWYWRSLATVAAVVALVAGGWILAQAFGGAATIARADAERELAGLKGALERQAAELAELRSLAAQSDRNVLIDGAAAADLAKQVKALTFENAAL